MYRSVTIGLSVFGADSVFLLDLDVFQTLRNLLKDSVTDLQNLQNAEFAIFLKYFVDLVNVHCQSECF